MVVCISGNEIMFQIMFQIMCYKVCLNGLTRNGLVILFATYMFIQNIVNYVLSDNLMR